MTALLTDRTPSPARVHFGLRLRHWRRTAGLTQAELGRRMAYDHSFISRVERGSRWPTRELAMRCDEFLHANGELVELWSAADLERQAAGQRIAAPVAMTAMPPLPTAPVAGPAVVPASMTAPAVPPDVFTGAGRSEADASPDSDVERHRYQVKRWLDNAPGPVLRRLADLVSRRAARV